MWYKYEISLIIYKKEIDKNTLLPDLWATRYMGDLNRKKTEMYFDYSLKSREKKTLFIEFCKLYD
jgi:hypothetical protein